MKLNNYQKIVLAWGFLMFLGYLLQYIFVKTEPVIVSWTLVISLALFLQIYWMWYETKQIVGMHLAWIVVSIAGGVATYVMCCTTYVTSMNINSMWFILVAMGMFVTGILSKNFRYYILCGLYILAGVMFQMLGYFNYDLIVAGSLFLALGLLDAWLETRPFKNIPLKS
jgi:hypothetical protein